MPASGRASAPSLAASESSSSAETAPSGRSPALIGTETPVGLIATGTNNNISSTLGLPADPHEAAEVAIAGEPQWVSAGRIGDYVFFEGAGIGLEADL